MVPPPPSSPRPPSKKSRGWWKVLGVLVLVVAGAGLIEFRAFNPANRAAADASLISEAATDLDSNPAEVYPLGKAFRLGLYTYTVAGCQRASTLGGQFKPLAASQGAEYVVVTFTVRNDSIRGRELSIQALKIEDANGIAYAPSREAAAILQPSPGAGAGDDWLADIEPGITKVLAVAFEIPVASLKKPLKLIVSEQGPFAGRQAFVYLKL